MMEEGYTKQELSSVAGYTYRRLHQIDTELPESKKLFVKVGEGSKYSLPIFVQRWVQYNVDRDSVDIEDLSVVKAKHEVIKTQKTELEVEKMRGQLVDVQDIKRLWGNIANTVLQNMLHIASKVAPMLTMMDNTETIASIIDDEIRAVLTNISQTPLPEYAVDDEEEE